ncbi:MAG: DNA repair protein RecN, partial [Gammaproteobacteria bacterium]
TGAGKSILIDALALALGERGDSQAIRAGADRLEVCAEFDLAAGSATSRWLADHELNDGEPHCLLRRTVSRDGRSRAWINGRPVPAQSLRDLGATLVDICGQQDYQSLRHRSAQRDVLDDCADHNQLLASVQAAHAAWQAAEQALEAVATSAKDRNSRVELLTFQLGELEVLQPEVGEFAELEREHTTQAHRLRIGEAVNRALASTWDDDGRADASSSAQEAIGIARRALDDVLHVDPELESVLNILADAEAQLGEAADQLRRRLMQLDPDPGREAEIADRLAALRDCARKHRCAADELPELRERLASELNELADGEHNLEHLAANARQRRADLKALATKLTASREAAAVALGKAVTGNMATLGMPGGEFQVSVSSLPAGNIAASGADDVEFLVTCQCRRTSGALESRCFGRRAVTTQSRHPGGGYG